MNYLLIEHADEEWDLPIPDYKAELAADQAWTLFDQAMDKLSLAINLSHLPAGLYLGRIVSSSGEGGGFRFVKE